MRQTMANYWDLVQSAPVVAQIRAPLRSQQRPRLASYTTRVVVVVDRIGRPMDQQVDQIHENTHTINQCLDNKSHLLLGVKFRTLRS